LSEGRTPKRLLALGDTRGVGTRATAARGVIVAMLALPPPAGDDPAERLDETDGIAAAVRAYAKGFAEDPGGLALEAFRACLPLEQRLERQRGSNTARSPRRGACRRESRRSKALARPGLHSVERPRQSPPIVSSISCISPSDPPAKGED
jgi:hypothetical protein